MSERKLTPKQARFVEEYLKDLNATQAAIRAGYSEKGATVQGSTLLANQKVKEAIQASKQTRSESTQIDAARVVKELATLAFSDMGEVLDFSGADPKLRPANEIPEAARRAIASIKVRRQVQGSGDQIREVEVTEFKFWDKNSALEKLCRHLGMFSEEMIRIMLMGSGKKGAIPVDHEHHFTTDPDQLATVCRILAEIGAGTPEESGTGIDTEVDEVHPA